MKYFQVGLLILLVSCLAPGCTNPGGDDAPALFDVSGEVSVDGKPLADGAITLEPADGKGDVYGDRIQDGKFMLESTAGKKRVSIMASRISTELGPDGEPMAKQYLPARYNAKTELSADVSSNNENVFEFKLEASE